MATALQIIPESMTTKGTFDTAILFDQDEYMECVIKYAGECVVQTSQDRKPIIHDITKSDVDRGAYSRTNNDPKIIKIKLKRNKFSTQAKIDSLMTYKRRMNIYYKYLESTTTYKTAIVDPNYITIYKHGGYEYNIVELTFYEAETLDADYPSASYGSYGKVVSTEIIFDPDGLNYKISGTHNAVSISPISFGINLNPGEWGQLSLNDIYIEFNDPDRFFLHNGAIAGRYNIFDFQLWSLEWDAAATYARLNDTMGNPYGDAATFNADDYVTLINSAATRSLKLTSVSSYSYPPGPDPDSYTQLNYDSIADFADYPKNTIVYKNSMFGKRIDINLRIEDGSTVTNTTVFQGVIRQPFSWKSGKAILKVDNLIRLILQQEIKLHSGSTTPTYRCNSSGSLESTLTWTTQTGSGTLSGVTTYTGANLGKWVVTFSSATDFTVLGPNCDNKAGSTAADFYDQTDATDSQIKIASASWGGTPTSGDVLEFYVCANFSGKLLGEIMLELLEDYGGVDSSLVYEASFTGSTSTKTFTISLDYPGTIGEAIVSIGPMDFSQLTYRYRYSSIPQLEFYEVIPTTYISAASIGLIQGSFEMGYFDYYNVIIVDYAYDYINEVHQKTLVYPKTDNGNISYQIFGEKRVMTIKAPGIYSETEAEILAKKYHTFYGYGLNPISIEQTGYSSQDTRSPLGYFRVTNIELSMIDKLRYKLSGHEIIGDRAGAWD
ncbi:hypothetical protein [Neomegalonema sp.]|uniref:hypothetical protein n=1 Tax=Neomegalonema sp. TaxID=2039713 RepID=UPI00262FBAF4|nr:hypothetical protein [Neomegalonema sp.]MDD2869688.1 hypothetical protein [Neomegalonema sp.]